MPRMNDVQDDLTPAEHEANRVLDQAAKIDAVVEFMSWACHAGVMNTIQWVTTKSVRELATECFCGRTGSKA